MEKPKPRKENSGETSKETVQEVRMENSFDIPEPGKPNPHTPSNDHVHLGLNLPISKTEE